MPWAMEGRANDGEVDLAVLRCLRSQDERGGAEAQRGMDQAGPRCVPPCLSQGPWCSLTHAFLTGLLEGNNGAIADNPRDPQEHDNVQLASVLEGSGPLASSGAEQPIPPILADTWRAFEQGYREYGGQEEWLAHFEHDVLPCEGGPAWDAFGDYSGSGYTSSAQFSVDSWDTVVAATGLSDPRSGYDVGANVAWWSTHIEHPGGSGGWPTCWWRGTVP